MFKNMTYFICYVAQLLWYVSDGWEGRIKYKAHTFSHGAEMRVPGGLL